MKRPLTCTELQLLALVKASLWQKPIDVKAFSAETPDWQRIGKIALQQTVGILVFESALALPAELRPPKEWTLRAMTFIERNRRTHLLVDKCVVEAVTRLREKDIEPVLLKGQAYARVYPRPEMRQCGDIDLYVGEQNFYDAYLAAEKFGWNGKEPFNPKNKHFCCELHEVEIELHRIAAKLSSSSAHRRFQKWSESQLSMSDRRLTINDTEVTVPTTLFDIVFVFLHLYHHFINGGIGLRQLCDWVLLLHKYAGEIDINELEQILKDFKLMNGWKSFAPIAVRHLGLPASECPFYEERYVEKSERILSMIFEEGNFGRARAKNPNVPEGYFRRKLYSFRLNAGNHMRKFSIDPDAVIRSFSNYFMDGTLRIIKEIRQ